MGCLDIPRSYTASGTGPTVLCGGSVSCCGERKSWDHCAYSVWSQFVFQICHYISKNPTPSKQISFLRIFKTHGVARSHDALAFRYCFSGRQNLMAAICWRLVFKEHEAIQGCATHTVHPMHFTRCKISLHSFTTLWHPHDIQRYITFSTWYHNVWFGTNMASKVDSLQLHSCWEYPCEAQMLALVNILEGRVEEVNMEPWNVLRF